MWIYDSATQSWVSGSNVIELNPEDEMPPVLGTTYYVSGTGNDNNTGTSEGQAWATIDEAMSHNYGATDGLLFERGYEYFGDFDKIATPNGSNRFLVGAYGTGAKPIFSTAKILNIEGGWSEHTSGVWKIDVYNESSYNGWKGTVGNNTDPAANIGHLSTGGTVYGVKRSTLGALANQWDFYCDVNAHILYVKSTANPATLVSDLRAAPSGNVAFTHSNSEWHGVEVADCGGHGFMSGWDNPCNNVRIINCRVRNIGGSYLTGYGDGTTRYGNGIEIIGGGSNFLIQDNEVAHVYDTVFTCQGSGTWSNIHVTENFMHHSGIGLEMWATGGGGMSNILIDYNTIEDGGLGWGGVVRADQGVRSAVITYPWGAVPMDIIFEHNVIRRAYRYRYHQTVYTGYVFRDNDVQLATGTSMQNGQSYTINDASSWAAANSTESGSTFTVL